MNGTGDHLTKWSKPDSERQISGFLSFVKSRFKKGTWASKRYSWGGAVIAGMGKREGNGGWTQLKYIIYTHEHDKMKPIKIKNTWGDVWT
jgi:hypothetical protein